MGELTGCRHETHWEVWTISSHVQQWSRQHDNTFQFYNQKVLLEGWLGNHDAQCSGHGVDERIVCYNHHHKNDHNWVNKVGSNCKSGCVSDYAFDNGDRQHGAKNEIRIHNVVARPDKAKLAGVCGLLFEPICVRCQSPSQFEIQWQGYAWNNWPT